MVILLLVLLRLLLLRLLLLLLVLFRSYRPMPLLLPLFVVVVFLV